MTDSEFRSFMERAGMPDTSTGKTSIEFRSDGEIVQLDKDQWDTVLAFLNDRECLIARELQWQKVVGQWKALFYQMLFMASAALVTFFLHVMGWIK